MATLRSHTKFLTTTTDATASIEVSPINDAPALTGNKKTFASKAEDSNTFDILTSDLLDGFTDVDDTSLTVVGLTASNGTLTRIDNTKHTFKPDADFAGTVTLNYTVTDGKGGNVSATNTLTITPVNDAPF